jgi:hypothetical protein
MSAKAFANLTRHYLKVSFETTEESKERFSSESCVEIRPSSFGKGVFATKDIKKGEHITYYPSHYFKPTVCPLHITNPEKTKGAPPSDYLYTSIKGQYSITGHPDLIGNPYMLGHMVNDPCDEVLKRKGESFGRWVGRYILSVSNKKNCRFNELDSGLIEITATKDINRDEEIKTPYDIQYWGMKNGFVKDGECLNGLLHRLINEIGLEKSKFLVSMMK